MARIDVRGHKYAFGVWPDSEVMKNPEEGQYTLLTYFAGKFIILDFKIQKNAL